jgi:SepF-like predicted cell division protein (DUF552 family)
MPFNLFRKKKPEEEAIPVPQQQEVQLQPDPEAPQSQEPNMPASVEEPALEPVENPTQQQPTSEQPVEQPPQEAESAEALSKTYLKAMPLRELSDIENVKAEVSDGNIIILKVTPLAQKSIEDVKTAVNDLYQFAENMGGDIARLGEERIVICPKTVRIWREKTPKPSANEPLPTAA